MIGLTSKAACGAVIMYYWWRLWVREQPKHIRQETCLLEERIFGRPRVGPSLIVFTACSTGKNNNHKYGGAEQKAALCADVIHYHE